MNTNWIYKRNRDNKERYVLGEVGDRVLVCIGINPSTAIPGKLDNTLTRVKSRALDLGYNSWIMVNIYPQRATNPNDLDKDFNIVSHKKNLKAIRAVLRDKEFDVWAAWGTLIEKRPYLSDCLLDIYKILGNGPKWFTVGKKSVKGHPHHPLYLKKELQPDHFEIATYITDLN